MEKVLTYIMTFFMLAGAVDKVFLDGRMKLSEEFEEGIRSVAPLILSMAGIMCAAPAIGNMITPYVGPLFEKIGADPAMAAGLFLGIDMGGYPLTANLTDSAEICLLGGVLLSSMLGATISFTIPVVLGICLKEDQEDVSRGIVVGIISIPIGMAVGAFAGKIPFPLFVINSIPAGILSVILVFGLILIPEKVLRAFCIFGKLIQKLSILLLAIAAVEASTGIALIRGFAPLGEQLETIGMIGITLAGAYPFVKVFTFLTKPVLKKVGNLMGISEEAVAGILACLANPLPMFQKLKIMDRRGKRMAMAFAVPAMAALGDHLGYVGTICPEYMEMMVSAKLTAGVFALAIMMLVEWTSQNSGKNKKDVD